MKPINIFLLSRLQDDALLGKLERHMSDRDHALIIKSWEIDGLRVVADSLIRLLGSIALLEFYYSFQIPKIGKEMDLLRISDNMVLNIELKSGNVSDERIKRQLLQNRYYLSTLGRTVKSYTYISDQNRLVRLTGGERLVDTDWESVAEDLRKMENCFQGDGEVLFSEEKYMISPLTDPDRFLRRDYFLTSQQKDIQNHILTNIKRETALFQGFTGFGGTGKTLLLYDLAMQLSWKQKVAVLHLGSFPRELAQLNERLKRIDFLHGNPLYDQNIDMNQLMATLFASKSEYAVICIDEGHRLSSDFLSILVTGAERTHTPLIFSYDSEAVLSPKEKPVDAATLIEEIPGYVKYRLTNRIRTNVELSSFISCLMDRKKLYHGKKYPSVAVFYAQDQIECDAILSHLEEKKYTYMDNREHSLVTCKEYDKVAMVLDSKYYYDQELFLRYRLEETDLAGRKYYVRNLFHGLCRAKKEIALVIVDNRELFADIMSII